MKTAGSLFFLLLIFLLLDWLFPFKFQTDYSKVIRDKEGTVVYAFLNKTDKWRIAVDLQDVTPQLRNTILYKEDKYFYYHPGINPVAIGRALYRNMVTGRRTSGASTITMQLARLLDPAPRTYVTKVKEMFRALQLEWHFSKDEILQMYLNRVPYGGNIEGVKSASLFYYEQDPEALSLAQLVTLSIIPNRPESLRPGRDNQLLLKERNRWLCDFQEQGLFLSDEIEDALSEPLAIRRHSAPREIPHLAFRLTRNSPESFDFKTFIDQDIQDNVQALLSNYIQRLRNRNIGNVSALVVDNESRKVVAYVGSSSFFDDVYHGQIDGVRAVRSPGSTLKPFIYAKAIDQGLICLKTILTDVPVNYNGYDPENYDGKYHGRVTVEDALAQSLNVPAVKVLEHYGTERFVDDMIKAGFRTIDKQKKGLGLSVALGGCGVRLDELVGLYASFANSGVYSPLRYTTKDSSYIEDTICSAQAAWLITQTLTKLQRPDLPEKYENAMHLPHVAWKTGTSYGRRDAWSIGYDKQFTVGVWVGNFPGNGVAELNGAQFATPVLFEIFNGLQYYGHREWFKEPDGLDVRLVCSETGFVPSDSCANLITDFYLPGISETRKCKHHQKMFISSDEKYSYCRNCLPPTGYKIKYFDNFPPELIAWYNYQGIPYRKIPDHNPECTRVFSGKAPVISSLSDGVEYVLYKDKNQKLKLECVAGNDVQEVYWYVNDRYLNAVRVNSHMFFCPPEGKVKISCADDKGRSGDIFIQVKYF